MYPKAKRLPRRVKIHDVTLRDGEQQAGVTFRKEEKISIARALDEAGIQRIEAGLPAVSQEDYEAVKAIAKEKLSAKIFSFARCNKSDVDMALKCDVDGVVMEIPSSQHIISRAYGWTISKAVDLSVEATKYAAAHGLYVTFFTIDSSRASFESCWKIVNAVAKEGHMDSLTLVDTFGVCSPEGVRMLVRSFKEKVRKPLEIHCHNDYGLGVANTIAGVSEGVETIHTTVNAIGERMGNTSTEESVMALELLYGVKTGVNMEKLYGLSRLVEQYSGAPKARNKPVVGDSIFTVESGIIVGWWNRLKQANLAIEMLSYVPGLVGQRGIHVILGKKSGRDSILFKMAELGLDHSRYDIDDLLLKVKDESLRIKGPVSDEKFREFCGLK
jgi:isopropylmalate/homocitrate/citramalate synthase